VGYAYAELPALRNSLLLIENVGNLVCPAEFDLGEAHKAVILSVTEGDDKPLKYPDMFAAADLMVVTKTDLLPYVSFDVERCIEHARRVNPAIAVIELSATRGDGVDAWLQWLERGVACHARLT
jgi:hydrogenase nickel incorporation protein HypB